MSSQKCKINIDPSKPIVLIVAEGKEPNMQYKNQH